MTDRYTESESERMSLRAEKIWRTAEERIMSDVIRRIKKAGEITSTADYQINRLIEMGNSREEVERIIKEALNATWLEMFELYDQVAQWEYVRNQDIYEEIHDDFQPPEDNEWLKQTTKAVKEQTKDELQNLSKSYGFSILIAGRKVFTPFAQYYQQYVDTAIEDILAGGMDYNSAIRKVVTQMTNSGLRFVNYSSGHTNRADVAVRRAMQTGVNQITAQINEENAKKLDTEYFEVSWHAGARPDHQKWQGKVYTKEQLRSVCGYGDVAGLCGANCRHKFYPFIPGISERLYTDEWLDEQNRREAKTKEWNGRELNAYEQTQQQRRMELSMRAQREKIRLMQEAGVDADEIMLQKAKYQAQLEEYSRYSRKMNLPEQRERIYYDMRGRVAPRSKTPINQFQNKTKSIVKSKDSGIIEMYRKADSRTEFKFISDETFNNLTIPARKKGAVIIRGTKEAEEHLERLGAAASNVGDVLIFRKDVCVSEVLEETYHFQQNIEKMNGDKEEPLRSILNEIDAKQYLLENSDKYKIPRNEVELTKRQLESYKKQLEAYRKGGR